MFKKGWKEINEVGREEEEVHTGFKLVFAGLADSLL